MDVLDEQARATVNEATAAWRQGDCVVGGDHWFLYRTRTDAPLTEDAGTAAADDIDVAEAHVEGFAVVTQTCDIVRDCGTRPFVEVSPLVTVDVGKLHEVERGQKPAYAYIPGVAQHELVADLDRVMTVEKSLLATWSRVPGCTGDDEARRLSLALARKRSRIAFPDDFVELVRKLQHRMKKKHGKRSPEGEALKALREIRVRAMPSWDADSIEVFFHFIRDDDDPKPSRDWNEHVAAWLELVPETGRFGRVEGAVQRLEDLTAREYVESDPLDLDYLSQQPE